LAFAIGSVAELADDPPPHRWITSASRSARNQALNPPDVNQSCQKQLKRLFFEENPLKQRV
jgi:hypothetical protein